MSGNALSCFESRYNNDNHTYFLELEDIPSATKQGFKNWNDSFAMFLQIAFNHVEKDNLPRAIYVVNGFTFGYGKFFGRFLHLFDKSLQDELRESNRLLSDDVILVENRDASYFSANLHPPLLDYEIWAPGSNNNLELEYRISIHDLNVVLNDSTKKLELRHRVLVKQCRILYLVLETSESRYYLFNFI